MTGVTDTMRPVQLTNEFQPLQQMPSINDDCIHQSMLTAQTKNSLVGKNEFGSLEGDSKILATSSMSSKNLLTVV